jgi:hypothetical protein
VPKKRLPQIHLAKEEVTKWTKRRKNKKKGKNIRRSKEK